MASALTSSNKNSIALYLILLLIILLGVGYLFLVKQPSIKIDLQRKAFSLNASAFKNGIYLAHIKFLANVGDKQADSNLIDRWISDGLGLDYNVHGFPVGISYTKHNLPKQPVRLEDCRDIWDFVLGKLRPKLYLNKKLDSYWVDISDDGVCHYFFSDFKKTVISYHSLTGKVNLVE